MEGRGYDGMRLRKWDLFRFRMNLCPETRLTLQTGPALSLLVSALLLGSCASSPAKKAGSASGKSASLSLSEDAFEGEATAEDMAEADRVESDAELIAEEAPPSDLPFEKESLEAILEADREILEADAELKESDAVTAEKPHPRIPVEINENVRKWIHYFTVKDRERFQRFLERGETYKGMVKETLRKHGIPTELYYLAMIESGYVLHARSSARAVGAWQFMPATGRGFGLKRDYYVDERRDIFRATEAAAQYLKALNTEFDSWYLAMASYNAGPGRIRGAIRRGKSRDFWELAQRRVLPVETQNYVPKFLAASIIGKNPAKFGFKNIQGEALPTVKAVNVAGGVLLSDVSKHGSIPIAQLKKMNPHLLRGMTPANRSTYELWVPESRVSAVQRAHSTLARLRKPPVSQRVLAAASSDSRVHIVRRGQHLNLIAKRYGTSVAQLKRLNGLKSNQIQAGQRLRVTASSSSRRVQRTPASRNGKKIIHRVRKGEVLASISQRYGVSIRSIKRMNDLDSSKIYVGQRLVVR
jgi:membrane-bound lytic murein transglycosylase D